MKLSVIMPMYNVEKYVEEAFISIANQLTNEVELLIVDDGSIDTSLTLVENMVNRFLDKHIRILKKENGGLSDARNYGFNHAVGEYVWFFDSDDVMPSHSIDNILSILENDVDLVHFNVNKFLDGKKIEEQTSKLRICKLEKEELLEKLFANKFPSYAVSYIVKKNILKINNFSFPVGRLYEDIFSTFLVFNMIDTSVEIMNFTPYFYRSNADSITKTISMKSLVDRLDAIDLLINFIKDKPYLSWTFIGHILAYVSFDAFNLSNNQEKLEIYKRIIKVRKLVQKNLLFSDRYKFNIIYLGGKSWVIRSLWLQLRKVKNNFNE